jgi:hypothetical protein
VTDTLEDFESGTNGNDISTASIFSAYSAGAITYDNTQVKAGSLSALAYSADGANSQYAYAPGLTLSGTDQFFRTYIHISGWPTSDIEFVGCANNTTRRWRVRIKTDGTLQLRDINTVVATSSGTIPTGQWVRLEIDGRAGAAVLEGRAFYGSNLEGTTPDWTAGPYTSYSGGGTANRIYLGHLSTESSGYSWYFDDVAVSDTATPSPTGGSGPPPFIGWGIPI